MQRPGGEGSCASLTELNIVQWLEYGVQEGREGVEQMHPTVISLLSVCSVSGSLKFEGAVVGQADSASALRDLTVQLRGSEVRTAKDRHCGSCSWGHQPGWEVRKGLSE